ncbi:MAG: arabinogalactan endo-1,4-beta-galactosidase [Lachnospiraceae bacterium]|nr:arabinogalactan endo-1,4-beta-galactosidase [Lachnospiraceae bacterium]
MKQTLRKWCFAMAAVCILIFMMGSTVFAADGTAFLSDTTMTESGSITVSFSETATDTSYYNVQIADSSWSTTYVNTNITSGESYTIAGYSAGTYQIYIGYWENGGWVSDALPTTTFTVTEYGATSYELSLSISNSAPALGDSVTVTASFTVDGTVQDSIPDGCTLSIWYQNDNDWVTPVNGSSTTTSTEIYLSADNFTAGETCTVEAALYDSDWNTLASTSEDFTVRESSTGTEIYTVSVTPFATTCEQNGSITFAVAVTCEGMDINLSEQSDVYLWIWADSWADGHSGGLTDVSYSGTDGLSNTVTISFPSVGTYYIAYNLQDSSYTDILRNTDVATITVTGSTADPSEDITTGDLSCGFMRGMDLSTFYTNWENGAVYYDYEGNEYSKGKNNAVDFFKFLYNECGVNWVRLRVWNDPYDEDGNPYGGGNNDVATAAIIGKWASDAGMTVLIDFHYSDFWADPGHQLAPKAWTEMDIDEKVDALYEYTYESLDYLLNVGVNVGMVQVGNETNGAFCGEAIDWSKTFDADTNEAWQNMVKLFKSGSKAVREISSAYGTNIKVALHFTNPNNNNPSWYAGLLVDAGVDFDAIGISYYMYWHGTLSNLQNEIETIANTFGKEVFIAETAYPYTSENYDDLGNQVTSFDDFDMNANLYAISEAGQEAALTAILDTAASSDGCTGLFYWEPAWTALPGAYDEGTGWATKWASDYISYSMSTSEGSSFDNQALFNNDGRALPALSFFADYVEGVENLQEHTYVLDEDASTAATCATDGENVYVCSVCGDSYTVTVSATGHTTETQNAKDATCTEDGYTGDTVCTVCGETITAGETIPATGHDYETNAVVASTYEEQGYTVYTCTHCGDSYEADYTAVKVIDGTDENLSTKTTVQELTAVPDGLKNLYSSVDELIADLISRVIAAGTGYTADSAIVYDVVLQYSTDGGTTWINATVDNFPEAGITVTLPYPDGTDSSYEFTVLHMFTETSSRLGIMAGGTETPVVTKTEDGLVVTLTGLSPVAVSWKAVTTSTTETDTSSQTDTTTESTDTSGTSASSTTSAQTGDNSQMMLWLVLLLVSGVGAAGIAIYNTKRRRSR